jgi:hypothetical protein
MNNIYNINIKRINKIYKNGFSIVKIDTKKQQFGERILKCRL